MLCHILESIKAIQKKKSCSQFSLGVMQTNKDSNFGELPFERHLGIFIDSE